MWGQFLQKPVFHGAVRTDAGRRLIFLGGRGGSAIVGDAAATTFANNLLWQNDTSSRLSRYGPYADDYLPTYWPARMPTNLLTEDQNAIRMPIPGAASRSGGRSRRMPGRNRGAWPHNANQ